MNAPESPRLFVKRLIPHLKKMEFPGEPAALGIAFLLARRSEHWQKICWTSQDRSLTLFPALAACFGDLGLKYPKLREIGMEEEPAQDYAAKSVAASRVVKFFEKAPTNSIAWCREVLVGLAAEPGGLTPALADLMVGLAKPQGWVFVPSCRSAALLAAMVSAYSSPISLTWSGEGSDSTFCAFVIQAAVKLSRGAPLNVGGPVPLEEADRLGPFSLVCADTLPKKGEKKKITPSMLERMLSLVDGGGMFLALLPPYVISDRKFERLRHDLIEWRGLDAVMRVPKEQIPGIRTDAYILIACPHRDRNSRVLFVDLSALGAGGVAGKTEVPGLSGAVDIYRDFEWGRITETGEERPYLHLASREEIAHNDYDLDIKWYVGLQEEEVNIQQEYDRLAELECTRKDLDNKMDRLLKKVVDVGLKQETTKY
jgi:hypothetical protein